MLCNTVLVVLLDSQCVYIGSLVQVVFIGQPCVVDCTSCRRSATSSSAAVCS